MCVWRLLVLCCASAGIWASGVAAEVPTQIEPPPSSEHAEKRASGSTGIRVSELKRHAGFLASDTLEGRQAGTRGGQAAAAYIVTELKKLGCQPAGVGGDYRQAFGPGYVNILAELPGSDAADDHDVILLGAHYDHVGFGNPNNSYGPYGQIHNGADDNASGVAVLLELARLLHSRGPYPRTLCLAFWDAEEAGLLGSQHWVNHPTRARSRIRLVLNLDMIGRLSQDVHVMGWRTSAGLRTRLASANPAQSIRFQFAASITPDSDHYSFYSARLPIMHFDTGKHDDYHRPSDDVQHLNWDGMAKLGDVLAQFVGDLASTDTMPPFRIESWNERTHPWPQVRKIPPEPRFGVTFHPERAAEGVIEVSEVVTGYPAADVGLAQGDRLVEFGPWQQGTLQELRAAITEAPAEVTLSWQRPPESTLRTGRVRLRGPPVLHGLQCRLDSALPGCAIVDSVVETSAGDRAGLWPGDVLMQVNGNEITSLEHLTQWLNESPRPVSIRAERRGQPFTVRLRSSGTAR